MTSVEQIINTLIQNVKTEEGVVNIRSRFGKEYERPDSIRIKGKKKQITPDLVIESGERTDMFIVELAANFDVEKWRLLSLYTRQLHGSLYILAPMDYEAFISRKLEEFNISARIIPFTE
jgi:hypothetical protein